MDFSHYLPNTEKRIERLRAIINKRPVAIMALGYSLTELENRIEELRDCDICYVGMNTFLIPDKHIVQRIGKNLSVAMAPNIPGLPSQIDNVVSFLERQDENIFITDEPALRQPGFPQWYSRDRFVQKYDGKLLVYDAVWGGNPLYDHVPSPEYPLHFSAYNSLTMLLSLVVIGGSSKIALFGADGGGPYYRQDEIMQSYGDSPNQEALWADAINFNRVMGNILEKVYKTYGVPAVDIVNCSPMSGYEVFSKLSYDETFAWLRR